MILIVLKAVWHYTARADALSDHVSVSVNMVIIVLGLCDTLQGLMIRVNFDLAWSSVSICAALQGVNADEPSSYLNQEYFPVTHNAF